MAGVSFINVEKKYGKKCILKNINLDIKDGELVVVVGPSGCGKTTLLRALAGFETVDSGRIAINDKTVSSDDKCVLPENRNIAMVFQSYALWPHFNVFKNISYPLKVKKYPKDEIGKKVKEVISLTRLEEFAERKPEELSGGQQQRVALARCLVSNPDVMLLDEPLANLDVHLKEKMISEFRAIKRNIKTTMLYVTHDQLEAVMLADRIVVMKDGEIQQVDSAQNIYEKPQNEFVARFIGEGNILPVEILNSRRVKCYGFEFDVNEQKKTPEGLLCFKPENVKISETGINALIEDVFYMGAYNKILLNINGNEVTMKDYSFKKFSKYVNIQITKAYLI